MKIQLFLLLLAYGCSAQIEYSESYLDNLKKQIDYKSKNPKIPSLDSLRSWSNTLAQHLEKKTKNDENPWDEYSLNNQKFSGWAFEEFPETNHKFRFTLYIDGQMVRQIGYYDQGQIDHDFNMKDGQSLGSEKMWKEDGHLYIDHFYSEPGKMHGLQLRYHDNHKIARKALFEDGNRIFEIKYDRMGNILETIGKIPEENKID